MASRVQLNLTVKQAQALIDVLGAVGGSPEKSPRGEINRIFDRLAKLGFYSNHRSKRGSIYFKDYGQDD